MRQSPLFRAAIPACICGLMVLGGCTRKQDSPAPAEAPKPAQTSVDQILAKPAGDATAPPPAPEVIPVSQANQAAQPEPQTPAAAGAGSRIPGDTSSIGQVPPEAFVKLNVSLVIFRGKYQRLPRDWNELISSKCLDKMPAPPAGKQYIFDASGNVLLR